METGIKLANGECKEKLNHQNTLARGGWTGTVIVSKFVTDSDKPQ